MESKAAVEGSVLSPKEGLPKSELPELIREISDCKRRQELYVSCKSDHCIFVDISY